MNVVLSGCSQARQYQTPLCWQDLRSHSPEGRSIIQATHAVKDQKQLAVNAIELCRNRGKAMTKDVVGTLSNDIPTSRASSMLQV